MKRKILTYVGGFIILVIALNAILSSDNNDGQQSTQSKNDSAYEEVQSEKTDGEDGEQPKGDKEIEEFQQKYDELLASYEELEQTGIEGEERLSELENKVSSYKKEISKYKKRINKQDRKISKLQNKVTALKQDKKQLQTKIKSQGAGTSATASTGSTTVYITDTGSKYHRAGCRYLSSSSHSISLSSAKQQGYTACSVCY